jgi:hypothetical protein
MSDLKIVVEPKEGEVIFRTGTAPDIEVPKQFAFSGNIDSPGNFYEDRIARSLFNPDTSNVVFDKRNLRIVLTENEKSPKANIVIGTLKENPDLTAFRIWGQPEWGLAEMIKFLRKNKRFFKSKEEFDRTVKNLSEYTYKREVQGTEKDDRKGNVKVAFEQKLVQNIKLEFTLFIPLFEGYPAKSFRVEIIPEVTDGGSKFWFESVELIELKEKELEIIFNVEEERFKGLLVFRSNN